VSKFCLLAISSPRGASSAASAFAPARRRSPDQPWSRPSFGLFHGLNPSTWWVRTALHAFPPRHMRCSLVRTCLTIGRRGMLNPQTSITLVSDCSVSVPTSQIVEEQRARGITVLGFLIALNHPTVDRGYKQHFKSSGFADAYLDCSAGAFRYAREITVPSSPLVVQGCSSEPCCGWSRSCLHRLAQMRIMARRC
jgi:hypothetical protein